VAALYDNIGRSYSGSRQTDPRIASAIERAIDGCDSILNVGAGTGSYEPRARTVVAIEPSGTMIAQRLPGSAPVVQARAEALPFRARSFDAVLGILTVHHWGDQARGFSECARVTRSRVVYLTIDIEVCARFWLYEYLPELLRVDRLIFPGIELIAQSFASVETIVVPIPADCRDGFLCAYWKRPRAYLDQRVRDGISTFAKIDNIDAELARLAADIESGAWAQRYSGLGGLEAVDLGYRLVIDQNVERYEALAKRLLTNRGAASLAASALTLRVRAASADAGLPAATASAASASAKCCTTESSSAA
jgi:SAM-dependent methyltransferase